MRQRIDHWLSAFMLDDTLHLHVCEVLVSLPEHVRDDLINDPAFVIYDYEPGPDVVMQVPVRLSTTNSGSHGRSVVLKRTLIRRTAAFTRYIIAHELAHAYLRNDGRHPDEDPEHAADALAAEWGFPKVPWR